MYLHSYLFYFFLLLTYFIGFIVTLLFLKHISLQFIVYIYCKKDAIQIKFDLLINWTEKHCNWYL